MNAVPMLSDAECHRLSGLSDIFQSSLLTSPTESVWNVTNNTYQSLADHVFVGFYSTSRDVNQLIQHSFYLVQKKMHQYLKDENKMCYRKLDKQKRKEYLVDMVVDIMDPVSIPKDMVQLIIAGIEVVDPKQIKKTRHIVSISTFSKCMQLIQNSLLITSIQRSKQQNQLINARLIWFCVKLLVDFIQNIGYGKEKKEQKRLPILYEENSEDEESDEMNKNECGKISNNNSIKTERIRDRKNWRMTPEQFKRVPFHWKWIYIVNPYTYVFKNEIKHVSSNRAAFDLLRCLSKKIHSNCISFLETKMKNSQSEFSSIEPIEIGNVSNFCESLCKYVLKGKVNNKKFDLYDSNTNILLYEVLENQTPLSRSFIKLDCYSNIVSMLSAFFSSHGAQLSAKGLQGLVYQFINFSNDLSLDAISYALSVENERNKLVIESQKTCCRVFPKEMYEKNLRNDREFITANRLFTLTHASFQRTLYGSSLWFDIRNAHDSEILEHVFEWSLITSLSSAAQSIFTSWLLRLRTRMNNMLNNGELKKLADKSFGEKLHIGKNECIPTDVIVRMKRYSSEVMRKLFNDEEYRLFDGEWEVYALSCIHVESSELLDILKFRTVAMNVNPMVKKLLESKLKNERNSDAKITFCLAQILRFVIRLVMHTLRFTMRINIVKKQMNSITYNGQFENDLFEKKCNNNNSNSQIYQQYETSSNKIQDKSVKIETHEEDTSKNDGRSTVSEQGKWIKMMQELNNDNSCPSKWRKVLNDLLLEKLQSTTGNT